MDIKTLRWNVLWAVQKSARYHARRQAFFDRWRMATSGTNVVFGSAAAASLVRETDPAFVLGAALVVTLLSAVDLIVGTAGAARLHGDLRRRFLVLEGDIRCTVEAEATKEDVDRWTLERLRIEADEPPTYVGLDLLCENEMARAHGHPPRVKLTKRQIRLAHWLRQDDLAPETAT